MSPEERDFHLTLDRNPQDSLTRLVLADWLEEHDDPQRAEGYRVLGTMGRCPTQVKLPHRSLLRWRYTNTDAIPKSSNLPNVWLRRIQLSDLLHIPTRYEVEEAAIRAWHSLNSNEQKQCWIWYNSIKITEALQNAGITRKDLECYKLRFRPSVIPRLSLPYPTMEK